MWYFNGSISTPIQNSFARFLFRRHIGGRFPSGYRWRLVSRVQCLPDTMGVSFLWAGECGLWGLVGERK
jgi:hypothetical protein